MVQSFERGFVYNYKPTVEPSSMATRLGNAPSYQNDLGTPDRMGPVTVQGGSRAVLSTDSMFAAPMSAQDALLTRRTINDFEAELPAGWKDALERAVEAATFAPNHKRTEPWRFHLLGPSAIQRVCELNAELVSASKGEAAGAKKLK